MNTILSRTLFRNAALAVAAAAALTAMPAFAESPTVNTEIDSAVSTKTRAEVTTELQQARASGAIRVTSASYNPLAESRSLKARAEVKAELMASRGLPSIATEDSGSFAMSVPQHQDASFRVAQR